MADELEETPELIEIEDELLEIVVEDELELEVVGVTEDDTILDDEAGVEDVLELLELDEDELVGDVIDKTPIPTGSELPPLISITLRTAKLLPVDVVTMLQDLDVSVTTTTVVKQEATGPLTSE
jgi:hypothetical protein